jgi:hypothetical protein
MTFERTRVLIWGKTYPELSARYVETVCTGGILPGGEPIRLYPVPLRYLSTGQQYRLYDWIEVPTEKSRSDPRPESYRVVSDKIECINHLDTDRGSWRSRQELIFRNPSWHFGSVGLLKDAQKRSKRSMGLVTPGKIENVKLVRKAEKDRREYESKMVEIQQQRDVFRPEYKELEFLPYDVKLSWTCLDHCAECARRPHEMKVLDWGLLELGRRKGWESARSKLEEITSLATHDFRLFMGSFRLHAHVFGIIGLWYPKRKTQLDLL